MSQSERLQRQKEHTCFYEDDELFAKRIAALLNHEDITPSCMVDAYYYDYSTIPRDIVDSLNISRDAYLIFGITHNCELVYRWVDRSDLDSNDPIVDGVVIKTPYVHEPCTNALSAEIRQSFDSKLLSHPSPTCLHELFSIPNAFSFPSGTIRITKPTKKDRLLWAEDRVHRLQDKLQLAFDEFYRLQDEEEEEKQEKK